MALVGLRCLPDWQRLCRAAAASPLGESGGQVMRGHLPGCERGTAMPRPGNGCGGSAEPPGKRCQRNWRRSPCPGPVARSSWWQRIPDEAAAREDYQVVKDAHAAGLVGSYDAAVVTKDASGKVHENKDETATRHGAWWGIAAGAAIGVIFPPAVLGAAAVGGVAGGLTGHLSKGMSRSDAKQLGDFIDPGQAGLVVVGESKVEDAIKNAVTRAEKQTAQELDVDPKDLDKALQQAVNEM